MKDRKIEAQMVYLLTSQIPKGRVSTYGAMARALKAEGAARAIGQVLKRNPTPIMVPCHRVVKSDGSMGGYNGIHGIPRKVRLLRSEGVIIENGKVKNLEKILFSNFRSEFISRKANR